MKRGLFIPVCIAFVMIIIFWQVARTLPIVLVFIPGVLITFIIYLSSFYRKTPSPEKILPLYLFALAIQYIHFAEEYVTGFTIEVAKLLGQAAYPQQYWTVFNMVAYAVFILGGIIIFQKKTAYMLIPLFFIVVGVVLNSIGHLLISIYVGGYFCGLYSALIYVVIGPILVSRIIRETRMSGQVKPS